MGAILGLLSALAYGASDFAAGLASRRVSAVPVSMLVLLTELAFSGVATVFFHGTGPGMAVVLWGAASGIASAGGTLALYHGFAVGRMSVVATLAGVVTVVLPAIVGISEGNHVSWLIVAGIVAAVVAVGLVSWSGGSGRGRSGALYGLLAGVSFALLFITLDHAGSGSGAWPVFVGQIVACACMAPLGWRAFRAGAVPTGGALWQSLGAGVLGGVAVLAYLVATGFGELTVIAVLAAMYPAVTVLLARIVLHEKWSRLQAGGLILSVLSVLAVAWG